MPADAIIIAIDKMSMACGCYQLINIVKIARVRAVRDLSDVSRGSFCRQQSALSCGLTRGSVTMLSDRQDCKLSNVGLVLQLRHNGTGIQLSQRM